MFARRTVTPEECIQLMLCRRVTEDAPSRMALTVRRGTPTVATRTWRPKSGSMDCTGPGHPISIGFREWSWSPPAAPLPVFDDPLGVYESWDRALEWFDPIMRNGDGVFVEVTSRRSSILGDHGACCDRSTCESRPASCDPADPPGRAVRRSVAGQTRGRAWSCRPGAVRLALAVIDVK